MAPPIPAPPLSSSPHIRNVRTRVHTSLFDVVREFTFRFHSMPQWAEIAARAGATIHPALPGSGHAPRDQAIHACGHATCPHACRKHSDTITIVLPPRASAPAVHEGAPLAARSHPICALLFGCHGVHEADPHPVALQTLACAFLHPVTPVLTGLAPLQHLPCEPERPHAPTDAHAHTRAARFAVRALVASLGGSRVEPRVHAVAKGGPVEIHRALWPRQDLELHNSVLPCPCVPHPVELVTS